MEIDTTKPHIGRVYDYVLGGHHNFDVDRQAAAQILTVVKSYPKWARLNRWFLQLVAEQWATEGRTRVLDLASGLPTQGHMHECMPDARILYSDNDPLSVAYGQQLLEQTPNAKYIFNDLRDPQALIDAATAFFGSERQVAVGLIGIIYLMDDEPVAQLVRRLHDWCAPGSVMSLSYMQSSDLPEHQQPLAEMHQRIVKSGVGVVPHFRTIDEVAALMAPWRIVASQPLESWLGLVNSAAPKESDHDLYNMHGVMLEY